MQNLIGLVGIIVLLGIAVAFSSNRKKINIRIVGAALGLQAAVAALVLYFEPGRTAIDWMSTGVLAVIGSSKAGIDMVFGPLADLSKIEFIFAVQVLSVIIFFSAWSLVNFLSSFFLLIFIF